MRVLGIMSGSSLDGLDMALCGFSEAEGRITHELLASASVAMPPALQEKLLHIASAQAIDLAEAHQLVGRFIAEQACDFLGVHGPADLIASHGHTAFHQPARRFTTQLGCGATIAAITGVPTVVDFRTSDVAHGGQGAPLVPIGERDLFSGYETFLNLGGIANISVHHPDRITGRDLCFCNQALNHLAQLAGKPYDAGGALARTGKVHNGLLAELMALPCLLAPHPFTLGREHFEHDMRMLLNNEGIPIADRMATCAEHIAVCISKSLNAAGASTCLVTGGGAFNEHLLERLRSLSSARIDRPDVRTVNMKEAIIFAYLGWLRWQGRHNALASVTGARRDSVGGAMYLP